MTKSNLVAKTGTKTTGTAALARFVAAEYAKGTSLPAVARKTDAKTGEKTIHVVAPLFWAEVAKSLGSIPATDAAIYAARKSGNRREVVAYRAGVSVARVAAVEAKGSRRPVYTGRGTRRHLAAKTA